MPVRKIYTRHAIRKALQMGGISMDHIEKLIVQSLRVRMKYALAPDNRTYDHQTDLVHPSHVALAQEAAEKSMVLIKNHVLPFDDTVGQKVAVIGQCC